MKWRDTLWISCGTLLPLMGCVDGSLSYSAPDAEARPTRDAASGWPDAARDAGGRADASGEADASPDAPSECVPVEEGFVKGVYADLLVPSCQSCHNPLGTASSTAFRLVLPKLEADHVSMNVATLTALSKREVDGEPLLLLKPTNRLAHAGGEVVSVGSPEYAQLEAFATLARQDRFCAPAGVPDIDSNLEPFLPEEQLWRAGLTLAGRVPTPEELGSLRDGSATLPELLDAFMDEPAFLDILEEGLNDTFHLWGSRGLNGSRLRENHFPNRNWFHDITDPDARDLAGADVAHGLRRAPIALMRHIAQNDLPFTELLTADYVMVNYASARSYDVEDQVDFQGVEDRERFLPASLTLADSGLAFPHAGVLTTQSYLDYYSTTDTNRNRGRSRVAYEQFLNTNVLEVAADGGGDSQSVAELENPVRDAAECSQCHYLVDPVAGAFQNYDEGGDYRPPRDGWYTDTFPTAFISATGEVRVMPEEESGAALRWLAREIVADTRFEQAAVSNVYLAVMGRRPLTLPLDSGQEGYVGKLHAYTLQQQWLRQVEQEFRDSGHDIKRVYAAVVLSRYFTTRRVDLDPDAVTPDAWWAHDDVTRSHLLTPLQLHRKIETIFGQPWMIYDWEALLSTRSYRGLFGGIDSTSLKLRPDTINPIMASVGRIMAGEVACRYGMPDMELAPPARRLFPHVDVTWDEVTHEAELRRNIAHLYWAILGETVSPEDPAVDEALELFGAVRAQGAAAIAGSPHNQGLMGYCGGGEDAAYTRRAWQAVLMFLLEDWAFIHH